MVSISDSNTLVSVTDSYLYIFDITTTQIIYTKLLSRRYQTILSNFKGILLYYDLLLLSIFVEYIVMGDVDGWVSLFDIKKDHIIEVKAHSKTVVALFLNTVQSDIFSFFSSGYDGILAEICLDKVIFHHSL